MSNRVAGTEFVPTQEGAESRKKHLICSQSLLRYTKTGKVKYEKMYGWFMSLKSLGNVLLPASFIIHISDSPNISASVSWVWLSFDPESISLSQDSGGSQGLKQRELKAHHSWCPRNGFSGREEEENQLCVHKSRQSFSWTFLKTVPSEFLEH